MSTVVAGELDTACANIRDAFTSALPDSPPVLGLPCPTT